MDSVCALNVSNSLRENFPPLTHRMPDGNFVPLLAPSEESLSEGLIQQFSGFLAERP
jgi:hypothetical protein